MDRAVALGAESAKKIDPATVVTAPWVRLKCRFGCGGYGSSLCCPPHTPTPAETAEIVASYGQAILFLVSKGSPTKIAAQLERELFLDGFYKAFGLGAGPCFLCEEECAFEKGCRHASDARPCMESCGIDVYRTVRTNGFEIDVLRTREEKPRFFGLVLVE